MDVKWNFFGYTLEVAIVSALCCNIRNLTLQKKNVSIPPRAAFWVVWGLEGGWGEKMTMGIGRGVGREDDHYIF